MAGTTKNNAYTHGISYAVSYTRYLIRGIPHALYHTQESQRRRSRIFLRLLRRGAVRGISSRRAVSQVGPIYMEICIYKTIYTQESQRRGRTYLYVYTYIYTDIYTGVAEAQYAVSQVGEQYLNMTLPQRLQWLRRAGLKKYFKKNKKTETLPEFAMAASRRFTNKLKRKWKNMKLPRGCYGCAGHVQFLFKTNY